MGELTEIEQLLVPTDADYEREDLDYAPKLSEQFNLLYGYVGRADARPTDAAYERFDDLEPELGKLMGRLKKLFNTKVAELNTAAQQAGAAPIMIPQR